jgi:hypothetical protein
MPPQQGLSLEDDERQKGKGHCMATPGACSVSTGCVEAWAIRNQRMPLRFKMKSIKGDYGSDTGVVVHLRWQLPRTLDSGEALMLHR